MPLKYSILLLNLFSFHFLWSQNIHDQINLMADYQLIAAAKHAERNGDFYSAVDYYKAVYSHDTTNKKVILNLARLNYRTHDYKNALVFYQKYYHSDSKKNTEALYFIAQLQKNVGDSPNSIKSFNAFLDTKYSGKHQNFYKKMAKNGLDGAQNMINHPSENEFLVEILDSTINHAHIETSPRFAQDDMLLFVSNRDNELVFYNLADTNFRPPLRNIYQISKINGKDWSFTGQYKHPFDNETNISSFVISDDGKRMYISKCHVNWKNETICEIYRSLKKGDHWESPIKLNEEINLPNYSSSQPAIGIDSKTGEEVLYFVSNRPGGRGGLDIWYSVFNSKLGDFKRPMNLGNKVNSIGDEITPYYIISERTLYFSSDFWPGAGGLDVFKIQGELKKWDSNTHLSAALNSSYDDLNFTLSSNKRTGFITSNRPGGFKIFNETCCDDLYEFFNISNVHPLVKGHLLSLKDTAFYNFLSKNQLINSDSLGIPEINQKPVYLFLVSNENADPILVGVDTIKNNMYQFNLEPKKEYLLKIPDFDIYHQIKTTAESDTIVKQDTINDFISDQPIVLSNIYYEFDSPKLTEKAKATIDTTILELMRQFPKVNVEILSHTDSKGQDEYNLILSQKRAESVVKYLISKGIASGRLIATGRGETTPIAENTKPDGTDNPVGRARNRRTEFRVIHKINKKLIYNNE